MGEHQQVLDELREPARHLRHAIPETWTSFTAMHNAAMADGALSARTKELVALAISVVKACDGCITNHAKRLVRLGATEEEVAEVLGVTLVMDGGPATVHGPRAWEAFLEFGRAGTVVGAA